MQRSQQIFLSCLHFLDFCEIRTCPDVLSQIRTCPDLLLPNPDMSRFALVQIRTCPDLLPSFNFDQNALCLKIRTCPDLLLPNPDMSRFTLGGGVHIHVGPWAKSGVSRLPRPRSTRPVWPGDPWISTGVHGYRWTSVDINGFRWISMDIH